jgi:hypothetical protein
MLIAYLGYLALKESEPPRNRTVNLLIKSLSLALICIDFEANMLICAYRYSVRKKYYFCNDLKKFVSSFVSSPDSG